MYIGRSYSWLAKKAMRGVDDPDDAGPRFGKHGKSVVYLREHLDEWLDQSVGLSRSQEESAAMDLAPMQQGG